MSSTPLSSEEIRAAAAVHRELGPEYHDAVVESFLAKVEKEIEARVDARLADQPPTRSRQLEPVTPAKRRLALKYMALGSGAAAIPLGFMIWRMNPHELGPVVVVWSLIAVVYAACALRLDQGRR